MPVDCRQCKHHEIHTGLRKREHICMVKFYRWYNNQGKMNPRYTLRNLIRKSCGRFQEKNEMSIDEYAYLKVTA